MLTTHHIDLDGGMRQALLLLGLSLLHNATGHEDLLRNLPQRRNVVVEQNARRQVPTKPEHHDAHDERHGAHGRSLLTSLVMGLIQRRNNRQDAEQDHEDDAERVALRGERGAEGEQNHLDGTEVDRIAHAGKRAHEAVLDAGDDLLGDVGPAGALLLHREHGAVDEAAPVGVGVEEAEVTLEGCLKVGLLRIELLEDGRKGGAR